MIKMLRKILIFVVVSLGLSILCFAKGETIFLGFDDNILPQGLVPNFKYTISDGIISAKNLTTTDPYFKYKCDLKADDYRCVVLRIKTDLIERPDGANLIFQVYYSGKNANGETVKLSGANSVYVGIDRSTNGEFVTYVVPLTHEKLAGITFESLRFDVVNGEGSFDIDYIMLVPEDPEDIDRRWDFNVEGSSEGWTLHKTGAYVSGGCLVYKGADTYSNPYFTYNNLNINGDDYDGIEVVMKHSLKPDEPNGTTASSTTIQFYYTGTTASQTQIKLSEANSKKYEITDSSGDNFRYYYVDMKDAKNWKGSAIASMRFDVLNSNGEAYVESIRLVPSEASGKKPLDETAISLQYSFEDDDPLTADGVISLDMQNQSLSDIKRMILYWGKSTDGTEATPLADYTAIKTFLDGEFSGEYSINKDLIIPYEATSVIAVVTDCEKTFNVVYNLPEHKKSVQTEQPLYKTAFISDIHVGGFGSETAANSRLVAARNQINELADHVMIVGDLTQWYGAYSGEEFKKYNYDGKTYKDNGETDTSYLSQQLGHSQWSVLREYIESFTVPVYLVQGNHDIRDGEKWNSVYYNSSYWYDLFYDWIDYSNSTATTQKYENTVEYSREHAYYDTVINGHQFIFLALPNLENGTEYYSFGAEQLAWLDKKLYQNERTGNPTFVCVHVPTKDSKILKNPDALGENDRAFREIINKHPTAIIVSGHKHYDLDADFAYSYNGAQELPSEFNDGGASMVGDVTEQEGSLGIIAEVYSDRIILRGRNFVENKWISRAQTILTFKNSLDTDINLVKEPYENGTWRIFVKNSDSQLNYTYIVDGVEGNIINPNTDYVAVRATDANGSYVTLFNDDISTIPNNSSGPVVPNSIKSFSTQLDVTAGKLVSSFELSSPANGMAFVAVYNGTRLVAVKNVVINSDNTVYTVEMSANRDFAGYTAKVICVKSVASMKPLTSPAERILVIENE